MVTRFAPYPVRSRIVAPAARPSVPMDAVRSEDSVELYFDLPGVDPSAVDLTVDRNVLTLSASRSWAASEGQQVLVSERRQGEFHRQVRLSDTLDGSKVEAAFDNGVLKVRIPVAESAQPRKVDIALGSPLQADAAPALDEATEEPSAN